MKALSEEIYGKSTQWT